MVKPFLSSTVGNSGKSSGSVARILTAGDVDHIAIGLKGDDIVGQLPDDLAEKPGGEYQASLLINLSGHHGTDPGFQVIARQAQVGPGFQEDTL